MSQQVILCHVPMWHDALITCWVDAGTTLWDFLASKSQVLSISRYFFYCNRKLIVSHIILPPIRMHILGGRQVFAIGVPINTTEYANEITGRLGAPTQIITSTFFHQISSQKRPSFTFLHYLCSTWELFLVIILCLKVSISIRIENCLFNN